MLKGGSAPRSVDEDPSARRIAAAAAAAATAVTVAVAAVADGV